MTPRIIALLVVAVLALIIIVQNSHPATFRLLFWKFETSLLALILVLLAVGCAGGFIAARILGRRSGSQD